VRDEDEKPKAVRRDARGKGGPIVSVCERRHEAIASANTANKFVDVGGARHYIVKGTFRVT
jgi:hypothetical protein